MEKDFPVDQIEGILSIDSWSAWVDSPSNIFFP